MGGGSQLYIPMSIPDGDTVTPEQTAGTLVAWFASVGGASLKLPNGWFGRPYDNQHRLTDIESSEDLLILTLDERQELRISAPQDVETSGKRLAIASSVRIDWNWREYGSDDRHCETFNGGVVEFLGT
jgi:hypothetical protein